MSSSKIELSCLVDSGRDFLKTSNKTSKCLKFHFRNPKLRLDLQKQKTIFSLIPTITIWLNIQIEKLVDRSDLETTFLVSFLSKILVYTAISLLLEKLSTLIIAKFTTWTKSDITLQTKTRSITMCSVFTPDSRFDNSFFKDIVFEHTLRAEIMTFESLNRNKNFCSQCKSLCQVSNFPIEEQTKWIFLKFAREICVLKEMKESIQGVIGDAKCPLCANEKCVYLWTNQIFSLCDCKECEVCSHVLKIPFRDRKPTLMSFGGNGTRCFAKKVSHH